MIAHVQTRQLVLTAIQRNQCCVIAHVQTRQLVPTAMQIFQCCVIAHVQTRQLIHTAIQLHQFRILAQIQTCQLVLPAMQRNQCRIIAHIQTCQLVRTAIQICQCCVIAHVQTRQLVLTAIQICQCCVIAHVQTRQLVPTAIQIIQCCEIFHTRQSFDAHIAYIDMSHRCDFFHRQDSIIRGIEVGIHIGTEIFVRKVLLVDRNIFHICHSDLAGNCNAACIQLTDVRCPCKGILCKGSCIILARKCPCNRKLCCTVLRFDYDRSRELCNDVLRIGIVFRQRYSLRRCKNRDLRLCDLRFYACLGGIIVILITLHIIPDGILASIDRFRNRSAVVTILGECIEHCTALCFALADQILCCAAAAQRVGRRRSLDDCIRLCNGEIHTCRHTAIGNGSGVVTGIHRLACKGFAAHCIGHRKLRIRQNAVRSDLDLSRLSVIDFFHCGNDSRTAVITDFGAGSGNRITACRIGRNMGVRIDLAILSAAEFTFSRILAVCCAAAVFFCRFGHIADGTIHADCSLGMLYLIHRFISDRAVRIVEMFYAVHINDCIVRNYQQLRIGDETAIHEADPLSACNGQFLREGVLTHYCRIAVLYQDAAGLGEALHRIRCDNAAGEIDCGAGAVITCISSVIQKAAANTVCTVVAIRAAHCIDRTTLNGDRSDISAITITADTCCDEICRMSKIGETAITANCLQTAVTVNGKGRILRNINTGIGFEARCTTCQNVFSHKRHVCRRTTSDGQRGCRRRGTVHIVKDDIMRAAFHSDGVGGGIAVRNRGIAGIVLLLAATDGIVRNTLI